jgi:hypothetical protein
MIMILLFQEEQEDKKATEQPRDVRQSVHLSVRMQSHEV